MKHLNFHFFVAPSTPFFLSHTARVEYNCFKQPTAFESQFKSSFFWRVMIVFSGEMIDSPILCECLFPRSWKQPCLLVYPMFSATVLPSFTGPSVCPSGVWQSVGFSDLSHVSERGFSNIGAWGNEPDNSHLYRQLTDCLF